MSDDNKLSVIKREPRNAKVVAVAEAALELAKAHEDASEMVVFIRVGGEFKTMSTVMEGTRDYIAMLEIAKHNCLRNMMP